jgi:hypothetical protein
LSTSIPEPAEVVKIDLSVGSLHTVLVDGKPHIVLRPAIEALGLSYAAQSRKLKGRSWATVAQTATVAEDGKVRDMDAVPVRTFLMLLANVNENRVAEQVRPVLVAFQNETADAIEQYWTQGGAINSRASVEQVSDLRRQLDDTERARTAEARLAAMGVAKKFGLVNDSYVEGIARHELARMLGEEPDIDPADITITADEYLTDHGVAAKDLPSARTRMGRTIAALYRARYSKEPQKVKRPVNGAFRDVAAYTYRDLDLFDTAWAELARHYDVQTRMDSA